MFLKRKYNKKNYHIYYLSYLFLPLLSFDLLRFLFFPYRIHAIQ